ncbi:MAG: hypothetical protein E6G37_06405 [Actinobacteria bacterium]|nr:MAG: hypothetical protein E6G37_06405 [Actinomycetota bacterium]
MATTTTTTTRSLAAVILAAGKGKRLKSARPKVLHPICGRTALWHVVKTALATQPDRVVIVVGRDADDVRAEVGSWRMTPKPVFVEQAKQLGTGHAVLVARRAVGRVDDVLVANGDYDPVRPEDVRALVRHHRRADSVRGDPPDQRGGNQLDGVPARSVVRRAAEGPPEQQAARVLPERCGLDPPAIGRACGSRPLRHGGDARAQLARGTRGGDRSGARSDQREAPEQRRDVAGPGRHVHRRRRPDRP